MSTATKARKARKTAPRKARAKKIDIQFAIVGDMTFQLKVAAGTTLKKALADHLPGEVDQEKVEIRVNNETVGGDYKLKAEDIVTVIPKIVGGR